MPRTGDNIRKRKDGRWEARYTTPYDGNLTKKYYSVYGRTYKEAKEKRNVQLASGQAQPLKAGKLLFSDVLAAWQDANRVRLKASSVSRYQHLIDGHILPILGDCPMAQLSAAYINRMLSDKLQKGRLDHAGGLSAAYVRSIALVISCALRFAAEENLCPPLGTSITKPTPEKKELLVLSAENQQNLERILLENITEEKLLIYITLYTGIRIGEACALKWEDIDLNAKVLYVRHTVSRIWNTENGKKQSALVLGFPKTKTSLRCIPICSKLYTALSRFPRRKSQGYILKNAENNSFLSPRTFEYRYKAVCKNGGIPPVHYHALRHTFATRCIERGVDLKSLSEILGHANVSTTLNTYVHSSMELKKCQLEKLAL